jgi:hypothetical protein
VTFLSERRGSLPLRPVLVMSSVFE